MNRYTFDVSLDVTLHVYATSEAQALEDLRATLNGALANFGQWPDGQTIVAEVYMDDMDPDLIAINGRDV